MDKENLTINQSKPSRRELLEQYLAEKKKNNNNNKMRQSCFNKRQEYTTQTKSKTDNEQKKEIHSKSVKKTDPRKQEKKSNFTMTENRNARRKEEVMTKNFSTPCFKKERAVKRNEKGVVPKPKERNSDVRFHFAPDFELMHKMERKENLQKLKEVLGNANKFAFEGKEKDAREIFNSLLDQSNPLHQYAKKISSFWISYANFEEFFTKDVFKVMEIYEQAARNNCKPADELEVNLSLFVIRMKDGYQRNRRETFLPEEKHEEVVDLPSEYFSFVNSVCSAFDRQLLKSKPFGVKTPWEMIYKNFLSSYTTTSEKSQFDSSETTLQSETNNKEDQEEEKELNDHLFAKPNSVLTEEKNNPIQEEEEEDSIFASPELITTNTSPFLPELPPSIVRSFTPTPVNSMKRKPLTPRTKHFDLESPERVFVEKKIATKIDFASEEPENNDLIENLPISLSPPVLENITSTQNEEEKKEEEEEEEEEGENEEECFATPLKKDKDNFAIPSKIVSTTKKVAPKTEKRRKHKKKDDPTFICSSVRKPNRKDQVTPLRRSKRLENKTPKYKEIEESEESDD